MANLEHVPLTERLKKAEYLARALSEHLRQSYLPKLGNLRSASKVFDEIRVSDQELLDRMLAVLQSDEFTQGVYGKLTAHLHSIRNEMAVVLQENTGEQDD